MKPKIQEEVVHEFPFFRVYKNGRVEKFRWPPKFIPPSDDPISGVKSKDVIISTNPKISARIYLPFLSDATRKLPVILYVHGGGYSFDSAFSPHYHRHVTTLASDVEAVAVSVEYRLAPEHPIPACYEDCWAAVQWIAAHGDSHGPDSWLNNHADFNNVFIGGDSAGANISHSLGSRLGREGISGMKLSGMFLIHPMFGGIEDDDNMWMYMCPGNSGRTDQRLNPPAQDLARIPCNRVLVMVAEKDYLSGPGKCYYWNLMKSGWKGKAEFVECEGADHCFHIFDQKSEKALDLVRRIVFFIKQGCVVSSL